MSLKTTKTEAYEAALADLAAAAELQRQVVEAEIAAIIAGAR